MEKEKKKSLLWLWILLGCLGMIVVGVIVFLLLIILGIFSFKKEATVKKISNDDMFYIVVQKAVRDGSFDKELKTAVATINKGDELKIIGMDFDGDNKKDVVAYYTDNSNNTNNIITFKVDTKKEKVKYKEVLSNVKDESSLALAYSIEDDQNFFIYQYISGEYFVKGDVNKVVSEIDFNKNYYIIKEEDDIELNNLFEDAVGYKYGDKTISRELLKDATIDNDEILDEADMTQSQIVEKAKAHRDELIKAEEDKKKEEAAKKAEEANKAQPTTNTFVLNGKTMHFGKYSAEAVIFYENIQIDRGGSANADGVSCTWSYGTHDFGQDSSSAGTLTQCIILKCPSSTEYLTAYKNDQLGDGGMTIYNYAG